MTDHPRLQTVPSTPDRAYLSYHGAPLVDLTFRLLDWWLSRTSRSCLAVWRQPLTYIGSTRSIDRGEHAMMRRDVDTTLTARVCQVASLLVILIMVLGVLVQDIVRKPDKVDAAVAGGDRPARLVVIP
jgi:hypothetical protein